MKRYDDVTQIYSYHQIQNAYKIFIINNLPFLRLPYKRDQF